MPRRCFVKGCPTGLGDRHDQDPESSRLLSGLQKQPQNHVSMHKFPTDPKIRQKWVDNISCAKVLSPSYSFETALVCSDHFIAKAFVKTPKKERKRLHKEAFPTKKMGCANAYLPHKKFVPPEERVVTDGIVADSVLIQKVPAKKSVNNPTKVGEVAKAKSTPKPPKEQKKVLQCENDNYHQVMMQALLVNGHTLHADEAIRLCAAHTWGPSLWASMTTNAKVFRKLVVEKNLSKLRCFQLEKGRREWTFSNDPCRECCLYVDSSCVKSADAVASTEEKNSSAVVVNSDCMSSSVVDPDAAETPFERFSKEQATYLMADHPGMSEDEFKTHLQRAWLDLPEESKHQYFDEFDLRQYGKFMTDRVPPSGAEGPGDEQDHQTVQENASSLQAEEVKEVSSSSKQKGGGGDVMLLVKSSQPEGGYQLVSPSSGKTIPLKTVKVEKKGGGQSRPVSTSIKDETPSKERISSCPKTSYHQLIWRALRNSPSERLSLKDMCAWIQDHPFFGIRDEPPTTWKKKIERNLVELSCFELDAETVKPTAKSGEWEWKFATGQKNLCQCCRRKTNKVLAYGGAAGSDQHEPNATDGWEDVVGTDSESEEDQDYKMEVPVSPTDLSETENAKPQTEEDNCVKSEHDSEKDSTSEVMDVSETPISKPQLSGEKCVKNESDSDSPEAIDLSETAGKQME